LRFLAISISSGGCGPSPFGFRCIGEKRPEEKRILAG
jgi:hypothetical protein